MGKPVSAAATSSAAPSSSAQDKKVPDQKKVNQNVRVLIKSMSQECKASLGELRTAERAAEEAKDGSTWFQSSPSALGPRGVFLWPQFGAPATVAPLAGLLCQPGTLLPQSARRYTLACGSGFPWWGSLRRVLCCSPACHLPCGSASPYTKLNSKP